MQSCSSEHLRQSQVLLVCRKWSLGPAPFSQFPFSLLCVCIFKTYSTQILPFCYSLLASPESLIKAKHELLTHWISSGSSTFGSIRLEGRTRDRRRACRSSSARPLDTELILTHFSVGPRSKSSRVFTILNRASSCKCR